MSRRDPFAEAMSEDDLLANVRDLANRIGLRTYHTHDSRGAIDEGTLVVDCHLDVHPQPKGRPRFDGERVYTPGRSRSAEQHVGWLLRNAKPVKNEFDDIEVWLTFRTATRQRRDVDNMVKLVLDAANGVVWGDDVQVTDLHARVERGHEKPGIHFRAEVVRSLPRLCVQCESPLTPKQARHRNSYCSQRCYSISQHRGDGPRPVPNECDDCGAPLRHSRPKKCRSCWSVARSALLPVDDDPDFPDLAIVGRRLLLRELKSETGRLRPEQEAWIADLAKAGQDVDVWRPSDWRSGRIAAELTEVAR